MAEDNGFKEKQAGLFSALIDTTRTTAQIASEDLAFQRSYDPSIGPLLDKQASRLLALAQNLTRVSTSGTEVTTPQLRDVDSVEDSWKGIVDVIDNLLEKADASLDEYTGVIKKLGPTQEDQSFKSVLPAKRQLFKNNFRSQQVAKPQLLFRKVPSNDETTPFKPLLRSKPHATKSLEESLTLVKTDHGLDQYEHPYQVEITDSNYPTTVHVKSEPISYLPFESTQATLVDTPEAMMTMLHELKQAKEIAVDLEHHDAHSYVGLVSLMQISTREKDWIIDTLKPWREDLQVLNEVFTDSNIVKVLHGAYMDMIWLQRDLGLYVVGLFDTFHASRCLGYPRNSLAALLKRFVDFDADKQYQMADWRIRPLPKEMFNYARSDTHFLLFIYDNMRNELVERSNKSLQNGDLIREVLKKSKEEALQRYERSLYDEKNGQGPGGWHTMLSRTPIQFNKEQFAVFRAVHQWRDRVARKEDEGIVQVMSKQILYDIARKMPMDIAPLLGCWHPLSVALRSRAGELLEVIKQAKLAGAIGPEMKEVINGLQKSDEPFQREVSLGVVQQRPSTKAVDNMPSAPASQGSQSLRIHQSQFWGSALENNLLLTRQKEMAQMQLKHISLAIPLPQLTAEIFGSSMDTEESPQASKQLDPGARAEHQYIKDRALRNDVFIVKQVGGGRKRKATEIDGPTEHVVPQTPGEQKFVDGQNGLGELEKSPKELEDIPQLSKRALKKQKRLRRRVRGEGARLGKQQKLERGEVQRIDGRGEEPANKAFDYSSAPSVLHPKKNKNDRKGAKKSFDPYAKSLDAPKGMPRSKKEFGGKSFTFKK